MQLRSQVLLGLVVGGAAGWLTTKAPARAGAPAAETAVTPPKPAPTTATPAAARPTTAQPAASAAAAPPVVRPIPAASARGGNKPAGADAEQPGAASASATGRNNPPAADAGLVEPATGGVAAAVTSPAAVVPVPEAVPEPAAVPVPDAVPVPEAVDEPADHVPAAEEAPVHEELEETVPRWAVGAAASTDDATHDTADSSTGGAPDGAEGQATEAAGVQPLQTPEDGIAALRASRERARARLTGR